MSFHLILVGYHLDHTRLALAFCDSTFRRQGTERRLLVLNRPGLLAELTPLPAGWEAIEGSNALGEFSGWQEALSRLGRSELGVVFANDTITVHRKFTVARTLALRSTLASLRGAALMGFKDHGLGALSVDGLPLHAWVSTYCFALTAAALAQLGQVLYEPERVDRLVPGGVDEASFFAQLSPDLDKRMRDTLFGWGWYAAQPLTPDNAVRMRFKARCIIAEKLLSARCDQLGIDVIDPFERHPIARRLDKVLARGFMGAMAGTLRTTGRAIRRAFT